MRQRVESIFSVVVSDPGVPNSTERHRLNEQMDIDLINRAAAKRQTLKETIDRFLIPAEATFLVRLARAKRHAGQTGIYYDERGHPMPGSTLVRDPKFQDRVVGELARF
jgi:hypothetical protein